MRQTDKFLVTRVCYSISKEEGPYVRKKKTNEPVMWEEGYEGRQLGAGAFLVVLGQKRLLGLSDLRGGFRNSLKRKSAQISSNVRVRLALA